MFATFEKFSELGTSCFIGECRRYLSMHRALCGIEPREICLAVLRTNRRLPFKRKYERGNTQVLLLRCVNKSQNSRMANI